MKISLTEIPARNAAIRGMEYVAKIVRQSMGPFGQNLLSEKGNRITNDGASIANELAPTIENEFERRGALVVNQNITKINDELGDGSSTAWSIHEAVIKECLRYLPNEKTIKAKKTYSEVSQLLEEAKDTVISMLEPVAIKDEAELIQSAFVSVEDQTVAELIGRMQWQLGPTGRIIAEETNDTDCSIEKTDGIILDNGFVSSNLVTNPEKQSLEIRSPLPIILTNHVIGEPEMKVLNESILKTLAQQGKKGCILMARAFTKEAIQQAQENMQSFGLLLINAPYTDQRETMRDIEAVVGGRYIDSEEASLGDIYITDVGCAKRIVAQAYNAQISGIEDEQSQARIARRVELLEKKVIGSQSDFEKRMLDERIAQLTGGFAILKVGSRSITDRKRLKDKCDDAVNAVRWALKGGTVKGAGQAWKEIADKLPEDNILKRPLTCVYDQILGSAPEGWTIPDYVRDPYLILKGILEHTVAFVPTFVSINAIVTEKNPATCTHDKNNV